MEEDEEKYLLGGRYRGGRGDVPAWRQIWRRTRRCTCLEADIEEDHVLEVMEEDEKMYFEADIEEDHVLEVKEEDEKMYLEADIEEDHVLADIQQQIRNS